MTGLTGLSCLTCLTGLAALRLWLLDHLFHVVLLQALSVNRQVEDRLEEHEQDEDGDEDVPVTHLCDAVHGVAAEDAHDVVVVVVVVVVDAVVFRQITIAARSGFES